MENEKTNLVQLHGRPPELEQQSTEAERLKWLSEWQGRLIEENLRLNRLQEMVFDLERKLASDNADFMAKVSRLAGLPEPEVDLIEEHESA